MSDELTSCKELLASKLHELDTLRNSAVAVCASLEKEYKSGPSPQLDYTTWEALHNLALYCGCTHLSWWKDYMQGTP